VKVSKHHYAMYLARAGAHVFFVNPPSGYWQLTDADPIHVLDYDGFVRGLQYFPKVIKRRFVRNKLKDIEQYCGVDFDIIWSFDTSVFIDFNLCDTLNIAHIVDLNQNFNLNSVVTSADVCFFSSEAIGVKVTPFGTPSFFINHGYNLQENELEVDFLPGDSDVKIVYAGNLNIPYLAWDVLYQCARDYQHVDFLFIGPVAMYNANSTLRSLLVIRDLDNVFFIGEVESDLLQGYYAKSSALILCYGEKYYRQASNPHKLLEYLGSGKPIIASFTEQYREIDSKVIAMAQSDIHYQSVFEEVITNIREYSSPSLENQRRELAQQNSYPKQLVKISDILASLSYE
jgi:glycosyltransferase involved in cell wall biosynthesis